MQTPFAVTSRDKFTATVGFLVVGFAEVVRLLRADMSEADMDPVDVSRVSSLG